MGDQPMNIAQKINFRWYAWIAIAFAVLWFFFGVFAAIGIAISLWVGERLYRTWKAKKEYAGIAIVVERMGERLAEMFETPAAGYAEFVGLYKDRPPDWESYRTNLLSQIESVCNDAYEVHVAHPEKTLMRRCQLLGLGLSGLKLMRAVDINTAIDVKKSPNWDKDRDYLLAVIKKNEGADGTPTGKLDSASYQSDSGTQMGYRLLIQAQQDTFEAEMWAYVVYYTGDANAISWFEAGPERVRGVSVEYWQNFLASGGKAIATP
jgi:hypothetical protein